MSAPRSATQSAAAAVDHDRAATIGRTRRLIVDIDVVRALADSHGDDDPDWCEVAVLLARLRATLSRDLHRPSTGDRSAVQERPMSVDPATSPRTR